MNSVENDSNNLDQSKRITRSKKNEHKTTKEGMQKTTITEEKYLELLEKDSNDIFPVVTDVTANILWPLECQIKSETIKHISYVPPMPEPYYVPSDHKHYPKSVRHKRGRIVYDYPNSGYLSFHGAVPKKSSCFLPVSPCTQEDSLKFESRFESGNLAKAIKLNDVCYEFYLRNDLYAYKQKQWFYFRIKNMKKDVNYRFSIVNMTKKENLFNEGMRPLMYSVKDAALYNIGWRRCGNNISYSFNQELDDMDRNITYTLTFTIFFPYEDDTVYLAYCYPYTYSDLIDYLNNLSHDPVSSKYITIRLLCKTVAGNNVYFVTVDDPPSPFKLSTPCRNQYHGFTEESKCILNKKFKKNAIVITARVHADETPSSWMIKGFLDFLTSEADTAKALRKKFIFQLVPMLNPDGVIVGNTRCSLIGKDLNGEYKNGTRERCPTIWYTKLLVERMLKSRGMSLYCDLHSQYSIHNIYVYGCGSCKKLTSRFPNGSFPSIIEKNASDKFSFEHSKLNHEKSREATGRITMWNMGVANSFTIEASFGGSLLGDRAKTHFTTYDYEQMAHSFCQSILDFYANLPKIE